ncbi:MAG: hypothetical protein ACE5FS_12830 [Paracoccaceae bacterium]
MSRLRSLWREHRLLLVAFVIASLAVVFLAVRLTVFTIYWSRYRNAPLQGWMPIGYVAKSYDVPREALAAALGVANGSRRRMSLADIAGEFSFLLAALVVAGLLGWRLRRVLRGQL